MSEEFSLKESLKNLGQLCPVIKDKFGNVVDGFHRLNEDKNCFSVTNEKIDDVIKLELARLAVNFVRRKVPETELRERIGFLVKQGLKADEIAEKSGISRATVYRYMPQELKSGNAEAISEGRKRQVSSATSCDNCKLTVSQEDLKPWNGNKLCGRCYAQALDHPAQFHQRLEPQTKEAPKILNPAKDSWTNREAQMHPQKSKMELEMLEVFMADNELRPVQSDRRFPLLEVTPDFVFPRHNLAVFLDGKEVHSNREDRDQALREKLMKRHGVKVLSITYSSNSDTEKARIMRLVKEAV